MAEVLVFAEHAGGDVKKVTTELLTLARRFGEPAVVWTGPDAEAGRDRLAEFGATRVYVADGTEFDEYVVAPKAEALAAAVAQASPAAVLIAGTAEGKEIAAGSPSRPAPACSPTRSAWARTWSPSSPSSAARSRCSPGCGPGRRSSRCGPTR